MNTGNVQVWQNTFFHSLGLIPVPWIPSMSTEDAVNWGN